MPFVQLIRDKVEESGLSALSSKEAFNQYDVLEKIHDYILCTLQLEKLSFMDTSDEQTPPDVSKSCSPGSV